MFSTAPPRGAAAGVVLPAAIPSGLTLDHLSWSGIKTYSDCPRKFAFKYVENAPVEFVPAALAFGHAIHSVYELLYQSRLEGRPLPGISELMDVFSDAWEEETQKGSDVKYGNGDTVETLYAMAMRMIASCRAYVEQEIRTGTQVIGIEESIRFRLLAYAPPIEMRLDLLELHGEDLVVTDLKTSKSSWNADKLIEAMPQLVLYAHGLMPLLKATGAKRIVTRFLVITKGKTPKVQVLQPQPTADDSTQLKKRISDTWIAIQSGVFVPRESWQCSQCPYRKRCQGH